MVDELLRNKQAVLIDLRGDDRSAGLIEGAIHEPAMDKVPFTIKVPKLVERFKNEALVIFTCQYSAHRAPQCANWYREAAPKKQRVGILKGGFRGWEGNHLPVQSLAEGEAAKKADEVALKLGTTFVDGCLAGVPGGGFCMPGSAPAMAAVSRPARTQTSFVPSPLPSQVQSAVPVVEDVETIDPVAVRELLENSKCILVDLRGDERSTGLIEGAVHEPAIGTTPFATRVPSLVQQWADQSLVVFTCQYSAHRAPQCANWYRRVASPQQRVGILKGGFKNWEQQGLPVKTPAELKVPAEKAASSAGGFGVPTSIPGGGFGVPSQ